MGSKGDMAFPGNKDVDAVELAAGWQYYLINL
jgi:hypothetical protein